MVGFTGSRNLAPQYSALVSQVVAGYAGHSLVVGCARGADQFVRLAAPRAQVFYASAYGSGKQALAQRSMAMVQTVTAAQGQVIGFVAGPCPAQVWPGPATFNGSGSGSWATLAYAVHLGLSIIIYPCFYGVFRLPAWGNWATLPPLAISNVGIFHPWQLGSTATQSTLF